MLLMLIYGDADDATDAADNMVLWYDIISSLWQPHCGYWCRTSIHPGVEICGKKCSANGQMGKLPRWSLTSCNHQLNLTKLAGGQKLMWYNDTAYPTSKLSKSTLGRAPKAFSCFSCSEVINEIRFNCHTLSSVSTDNISFHNVSSVELFLL